MLTCPVENTRPGLPILSRCCRLGEKENLQDRHLKRANMSPGPARAPGLPDCRKVVGDVLHHEMNVTDQIIQRILSDDFL